MHSARDTVPVWLGSTAYAVTAARYLESGMPGGNTLRGRMTLAALLAQIGEDARFITIYKGIVVNADYILTFEDNCCIMENGIQFPVRVRDFLKIEQTVRKYHFMKIRERQSLSAGRHGKKEG